MVYNQQGFYDPLMIQINKMVSFGLMPIERAALIQFANTPEEAVYLVMSLMSSAVAVSGEGANP